MSILRIMATGKAPAQDQSPRRNTNELYQIARNRKILDFALKELRYREYVGNHGFYSSPDEEGCTQAQIAENYRTHLKEFPLEVYLRRGEDESDGWLTKIFENETPLRRLKYCLLRSFYFETDGSVEPFWLNPKDISS